MKSRTLLTLAASLVAVFGLMQLERPPLPPRTQSAELQASPEVRAILHRSCYPCHSNDNPIPLADNVAPAYWLVVHDIRQAQKHLNFANLAMLSPAQQRGTLFEAFNQIQLGAMPLPNYLLAHPGARVTPADLQVLRAYLSAPVSSPTPATVDPAVDAAALQFSQWRATTHSPASPELNGIGFPADYKNWQAISTTDRWDNGTLRVILGNDIAIKALAEGHINPWPDGTTFAKVAWVAQPAANGEIHTGEFKQVEFMIRDEQRYKSTAGWGWGRWLGTGLKPYGKDASFTRECVGCHEPVRDNDYVYTMPLKRGQ